MQRAAVSLLLFFGIAIAGGAAASKNEDGKIWAVLVAGSNGWWNYRHQADVCHAYHTLVNHGVERAHIITMMYDDIANNSNNPHPGKIYNHPKGSDVYAGVPIDYSGADVTPDNFMAVLLGQSQKVKKGKRVLNSTSTDKVFVYFSDHGGVGLIGFPGDIMTVKQLSDTLEQMHTQKMYKELTFYMEACESGSMFDQKQMKPWNLYALTAANADESSYATYCDTKLLPDGTCLGDEFSVNWMEDSDTADLKTKRLVRQYTTVRRKTEMSHVTAFRNRQIQQEVVAEFMGSMQLNKTSTKKLNTAANGRNVEQMEHYTKISIRDIPLFMLSKKEERGENTGEVSALKQKRLFLEKMVEELVGKMLHNREEREQALRVHPATVTQKGCHHQLVNAFHQHCFDFNKNPYALKYAFVLANLCEHFQQKVPVAQAIAIMKEHCAAAAAHAKNVQISGIY